MQNTSTQSRRPNRTIPIDINGVNYRIGIAKGSATNYIWKKA